MASPRWRMNGLWRRMAGALLLCALLLSNEVTCQDEDAPTDPTDAPASDPAADTVAPDVVDTDGPQDATAGPDVVADSTVPAATIAPDADPLTRQDDGPSGASESTAAPSVKDTASDNLDANTDAEIVPEVMCVDSDDISQTRTIKIEAATADCEETKRIIKENLGGVCGNSQCQLKIYQNEKDVLVGSDNVQLQTVARALMSDSFKDKLTVTEPKAAASSGSSVFVGILVSGLLAALGITLGYFKCQRRSNTKGEKLAEDPFPVDQENQGNTLVSVAPLNPPPEPQDKPSVNGESPEAAKTQPPPPTNGHSITKTADTEL